MIIKNTFKKLFLLKTLFAAISIFAILPLLAQPNDNCSGALPITCGSTISSTTVGAGADVAPFCATGDGSGGGVWYTWTGDGSNSTFSLCGSSFDTKLRIFDGSCGSLNCVAGNDDACGLQSEVSFTSSVGTVYFILVHGFSSSEGSFSLSLTCTAPLTNDDCSGALPISCGSTVSGSTSLAGADGAPFCSTSNTSPGVWYTWTGDGTGATLSTCSAGTDYDTKISVYDGTCGSLNCVAGNDDGPGCTAFRSEVSFTSTPGTKYYILVHGFAGDTGNFDLSLSCAGVAPANDDVCSAIPVTIDSPVSADGSFATAEAGEVNPGGGTGASSCDSQDGWCDGFFGDLAVQNSVWFTFVAPASGVVNITTDGGDTQLALWGVGDCSNFATFTEVAANDDGGPGFASMIDHASVTPGQTYYIQIDGWQGDQYNTTMTVTIPPVPLCNASGNIDGSQTFNRSFLIGPTDNTCNAAALLSGVGTDAAYQVFTIQTDVTGAYEFETTLGTHPDTYLFLYCNFDPLNSDLSLVAADDDGGAGLASLISVSDGVILNAGQDYDLVVTSFFNGDVGTFDLEIRGPEGATLSGACFDETIPATSDWGLVILALLLLSFGVVVMMQPKGSVALANAKSISISGNKRLPFDRVLYGKLLVAVTVVVSGGFLAAAGLLGYDLTGADIPGGLIASPILAYLIHLVVLAGRNKE